MFPVGPHRHLYRWSAYIALFLAGFAAAGLTANALWTVRRAERCMRRIAGLTPGKSTLQDARQLFREGAFISEPIGCTELRCSIGFHFDSLLTWWGLIRPPRFLQGYVEVRDGIVETIDFDYGQRNGIRVTVQEGPSEINQSRRGMPVGLSIEAFNAKGGGRLAARARDFGTLSPESRAKLLQFDSWCLVRIGGCTDVNQVLPGSRELAFTE